jgi:hypothetical protein
LVALGFGTLVAVLPTVAFFAAQGALGSLFDQTVRWTFQAFAEFDYLRLPGLWPLFTQDPDLRSHIGEYAPSLLISLYWNRITTSALFRDTPVWDVAIKLAYFTPYLLLALAALVVGSAWRQAPASAEAGGRRRRATLLVIYAAFTLLAFNPPRDWLHLLVLYHPTLLLAGVLLDRAACRLGPRRGRAVIAVASLAVVVSVMAHGRILRDLRRTFDTPVVTPVGTVWLPGREAGVVSDLLAYVAVRTQPTEPLPVLPYHPLLQFFSDRPSGTRSTIFWPVRSPEATDAHLIADFEAMRASTVIYSVSQYAHLRRFRVSFPELFAHLVERYEIVRTFTSPASWGLVFLALAPRRPAPAARVDLAARLDDATVFDETGQPLAGAARARVVGRTLWPFRRVVYQRPGMGTATTIAIPVSALPAGARLRTGYGFNPDEWVSFTPAAVTFSVTVAVGGDAPRQVFSRTLDPQRTPGDRAWHELSLALPAPAGADVVLAFQAVADGPAGARLDLAGWAEPVLE